MISCCIDPGAAGVLKIVIHSIYNVLQVWYHYNKNARKGRGTVYGADNIKHTD